jgi:hypothetical protein
MTPARLLLVLAPVLLLFLVIVVVILRILGGVFDRLGRRQRLAFGGFALDRFQFAPAPVIFPGIEHQIQPRYDLFDRRQSAGWTGFAARTRRALWPGLAGGACFAARALRAGLALRAGRAMRTRFALRPRFAARAIEAAFSGMTLGSGPPRFARTTARALRPRPSLPG